MTISFELPNDIEHQLALSFGDLGLAAKQALLVNAYRRGNVSIGKLAETLGMGVIEAQQWLSNQNVPPNYGLDEFLGDRQTISNLFPNTGPK